VCLALVRLRLQPCFNCRSAVLHMSPNPIASQLLIITDQPFKVYVGADWVKNGDRWIVLVLRASRLLELAHWRSAWLAWWRILDQLPQTPNQEPGTPHVVPATRSTRTTSLDQQRAVPRLAPPPAFGPSR
jgi:hypothetical protein